MTFGDHSRYRLSVFTREEAGAIVAYLNHKRDSAETALAREQIDAALNSYWLERAKAAPSAQDLKQHLAEEGDRLAILTK